MHAAHQSFSDTPPQKQTVQLAENRLKADSQRWLRCVNCQYDEGVLRLTGRVPTFYLKQLAQTLVKNIDGVSRVDNQVLVADPRGH